MNLEFPVIGIIISGIVCAVSLVINNKDGLAVGGTIAAISGTAYQTQVNATRKTKDEGEIPIEEEYTPSSLHTEYTEYYRE